jgi:hypothetical protein
VPCCTRTPASRCRTRPSPAIAARCWIQARRRSRAAPRRQRWNNRHPPRVSCNHAHSSVPDGHADRTSPIPRIFSAAAQASPVAATVERLKSNSPILKSKSLWVQSPRPTRVHSRVTRARRGQARKNAAAFASVCHWQRRSGARLHSCRSADRLPLSTANVRPKCKSKCSCVCSRIRSCSRHRETQIIREQNGQVNRQSQARKSDRIPLAFVRKTVYFF